MSEDRAVPDTLTPAQRRKCMAVIRERDTAPELRVRRIVHSLGFRFRLHRRDLPGAPDLVFPSLRKVIFVHGCFWHRHNCRKGQSTPTTRRAFWENKLQRNKLRDLATRRRLARLGWRVLVVWECRLLRPDTILRRIVAFLES